MAHLTEAWSNLSNRLQRYVPAADPASGLHDPKRPRNTYYFNDLDGSGYIGRTKSCWIEIKEDNRVSKRHAILYVAHDGVAISDAASTNGVLLDGIPITRPTLIEEGMRVTIGDTTLYAVDPDGRYPITAITQAVYRAIAFEVYGSATVAAERIGCSPNTIRTAPEPSLTTHCLTEQ